MPDSAHSVPQVVWVEPLVRNDIGYSGRATLLRNDGERADVRCLDGTLRGMELSVPVDGTIRLPGEVT